MKTNPNDPIKPCKIEVATNYTDKTAAAMLPEFENKQLSGLTKRELFAYGAMKALLQNSALNTYPEHVSVNAVKQADALINELNK